MSTLKNAFVTATSGLNSEGGLNSGWSLLQNNNKNNNNMNLFTEIKVELQENYNKTS